MFADSDPSALPEGYPIDFASMQANGYIAPAAFGNGEQSVPVHGKSDGYLPGWRWVAPPGVGDAPQHVYTTFSLFPLSIDGPGDRPASYLRSFLAPIMQNFAMRWQGMPVEGGNVLMTGLYTPQPMQSPGNDVYAGAPGS